MYLVRSSVSNHNEYSPLWVAFVVSHTAIKLDPSTILRVHRRLGGSAKSGAAHRRATKRAFTARPLQARCSSLSNTSAFSRPGLLPKCSLLRDCNYHYAETNPRPDGSRIRNGCVSASARRTNHRLSRASSRVVRSLTCGHELFRSDNRKFTFTLCTAVPLYHRITPAPHQIATCSSCRTAQSVPPAPELLVWISMFPTRLGFLDTSTSWSQTICDANKNVWQILRVRLFHTYN